VATPPKQPSAPARSVSGGSAGQIQTGRRRSGEERRRQIVAEAMRCFAAKGFRGTTTRDIASAVGITEAAIYRYFDSKEALYAAIIDEKMNAPDPVERVAAAAAAGDDRAVFEGLVQAHLEAVDKDPSFLRILLYTGLEGHELADSFFATRIHNLREFVASYIARRTREGVFRDVEPHLAARAILGMVEDYVIARDVFHRRDTTGRSAREVAATFVSIFLEGIRRREGSGDE
jgi:AcrR family transcriptional regulator